MNLFLIILAAGNSKRFKSSLPKPYHRINDTTLLEHSIKLFSKFKEIKKTIIVYNIKHKKHLNKLSLKNTVKIVGGKSRQESTFKALKRIKGMNCSKVLIHDSARPNPPKEMINKIINNLKNTHAIIPLIKSTDATKRYKKNIIFKNIKRETLGFAQTPQGFTFKNIYKKHLKNISESFDDDSAMFTNDKEFVTIIPGSKKNIKITEKDDLEILKSFKIKKNYFGLGFDVHRLVPKRRLYLGGLNIKSKVGTLGHSDGDPVLHAIIDGLLGACRMGDIGQLFPDSNKKFKNIRSTILLAKVINKVESKKFIINNLDINIITQSPKIKKYRKKMIKNISKLCQVSENQINIKGKTTEKLGVIGKTKAIACEVIVSVTKYDE
jgi:2-C-methyl-D-erythritol 4-phosphate cytidylyltransferase / 2-C-methyl-D-erythritol 2,4-cyclodiphosphate synthase